jgi:hypothetical protein
MRKLLSALVTGLLTTALAVPAVAPAAAAGHASTDIVTALQQLPGITYLGEDPTPPAGYREFTLSIRQPVDHHHPERGSFQQQLILLHKDTAAPMVVYTGGYFIYEYLSEPAKIVGGNELIVEHRFFGDSIPQPTVWKDLTIWQEATDEHVIEQTFKRIYDAHWLQTGISKGGMTAVYHDRFYPRDLDGVLAYSSPNDITNGGPEYADFINSVGTPECRADLRRVQREALRQRPAMEALIQQEAVDAGATFTEVPLDKAFEFVVISTPFVFWQYGSSCADIPPAGAPVADLFAWFDETAGWLSISDQGNDPFLAYDYQAGTQLGYPVQPQRHLLGLLRYPYQESARQYVPRSIPMHFDPSVMRDIDHWVRYHGKHLIFTYGSIDPYGATPFRLGPGTRDSAVYVLPGGSHLTTISLFPPAQRSAIESTLRRWAGVPVTPAATAATVAAAPAVLPRSFGLGHH